MTKNENTEFDLFKWNGMSLGGLRGANLPFPNNKEYHAKSTEVTLNCIEAFAKHCALCDDIHFYHCR